MEKEIKYCPHCARKVELRKLSDGYYYIELYYCKECKAYFHVFTYVVGE